MTNLKIKNVRVHVWTKIELKITVRQLKEGGFRLEKTADTVKAYDGLELIFMALLGVGNNYMVRLDSRYFDYK